MRAYLTVSDNKETILLATVDGGSIRWEVAFEVPATFRGLISRELLNRLAEVEDAIVRPSVADVEVELRLAA